jgi:RNA polymerase sigma-70 factor (ECF subfamily)
LLASSEASMEDAPAPPELLSGEVEGYGRELTSFLVWRLGDRQVAREVFSEFSEDLLRGLGGFRWQCSARVWSYTLARHAAARHVRETRKRRRRTVPLSHAGPLSAIAERPRTQTRTAAKTEARNGIARLREKLPADDRTLLVLRVNRGLDWKEIAQVMASTGEALSASVLEKETVRLRKRYQLAKEKLRRMAAAEGLIDPKRNR